MNVRHSFLLLPLFIACKTPAAVDQTAATCPAEQVAELSCQNDPNGCPKSVTTTKVVQGAALVGGMLPGAGIVSAAVSSVSISPYDGSSHVLVAATVSEHTVLSDTPDAPGVSSTSVVLMDLPIPRDDEVAEITSTPVLKTRDASTGRPTGRRSHATVAPFQTISVPESENAAFVAATLSDGSPVRLAAATALLAEHPRDGLRLYGLRSAGPGMPVVTEGKSLSIESGGMPNRISMNVTVPKQTQGATFGEKVNAGLHAAGSALSQGASLRVATDADLFGASPLTMGDAVVLGGADLAEVRAINGYRVALVSSETCPVTLAGLPIVERASSVSCGVSIWQDATRLPLDNPDNTPIIRGSALLAATVLESPGELPRFKLAVYDSLTQTVTEHLVAPFNGAFSVTSRDITSAGVSPVAIDAQYDNGGALWLVLENTAGTFVHAGASAPLLVRDARTATSPFVSLALFHAVEHSALGLMTTARPHHVALFSGNALIVLRVQSDTSPATADITEIEIDAQLRTTRKVRFKAGAELATKIN
jgi:hypothetical protein